MKKIIYLLILIPTLASAYYPTNNSQQIWQSFNQSFQDFNQLREESINLQKQSRQYFDKRNNQYIAEIQTQGIKKQDLNIKYINNQLVIYANKTNKLNIKNHYSYSSNSFYQSFTLPKDADTKNIEAHFKQGRLSLHIPKLKDFKPQVQIIEIN
jgi:HSP20 family molecular chaperone IbpA